MGAPVDFDDGVGTSGGRCFPLYARGRRVAWIDSYHRAGGRLYVRRCVEDAAAAQGRERAAAARGGYVEESFDALSLKNRGVEFVEVGAPLWSGFANPSFCGSLVAYWGAEFERDAPVRVYAVVYDLERAKVVGKTFLGATQIESDSRGYFAEPKWSRDGRRVTFDNHVGEGGERIERAGIRREILSLR